MTGFDDISALLNDVLDDEIVDDGTLTPEIVDEETLEGMVDAAVDRNTVITNADVEVVDEIHAEIDDIDALIAAATGESNAEPDVPTVGNPDEEDVTTDGDTEQFFTQGTGTDAIELPTFTSDEIMDSIDIRNFGTLVKLTTMRWHAKIKDRKAARDMAKAANAEDGTYEGYKHLLAGCDEKLKRIHKAIDAARTAHYSLTLPWSVVSLNDTGKRSGPRLLPNTLFMEYTTAMATAKQEMDEALDDFETAYPTLVQLAQSKMGTAFNPSDYPHMDVVRTHFGLHFDFEPIPKGSDFDGIQAQMAQKLAVTLDNKNRTALEHAMQEAWHRLYKTVEHAATVLANPDKLFHFTLIEKLRDQSGMLKHLNATADQRIEDVRRDVMHRLTAYDAKDIRKDDALRRQLATAAQEILEQMKGHINGKG